MNHKTKKRGVFFVVAIALVAIVGIAYAALTQQLNINGTGTLKGSDWNIHFANVAAAGVPSGSSTATGGTAVATLTNTAGIESTLITISGGTLALPGDSIVYTFDIVNDGTIDATLDTLVHDALTFTGTGTNAAAVEAIATQYVTWTLTDSSGAAIAPGSTLAAGTSLAGCKLTLTFDPNATSTPTNDVTIDGSWTFNYIQS